MVTFGADAKLSYSLGACDVLAFRSVTCCSPLTSCNQHLSGRRGLLTQKLTRFCVVPSSIFLPFLFRWRVRLKVVPGFSHCTFLVQVTQLSSSSRWQVLTLLHFMSHRFAPVISPCPPPLTRERCVMSGSRGTRLTCGWDSHDNSVTSLLQNRACRAQEHLQNIGPRIELEVARKRTSLIDSRERRCSRK